MYSTGTVVYVFIEVLQMVAFAQLFLRGRHSTFFTIVLNSFNLRNQYSVRKSRRFGASHPSYLMAYIIGLTAEFNNVRRATKAKAFFIPRPMSHERSIIMKVIDGIQQISSAPAEIFASHRQRFSDRHQTSEVER